MRSMIQAWEKWLVSPSRRMVPRLSVVDRLRTTRPGRSKCGTQVSRFTFRYAACFASDTLLACFSGTLELKATKESAHSNWVNSVAFSPDGKTIVSGSRDETIKVWDAGQPFHLLPSGLSSLLTSLLRLLQLLSSSRRPRRMRIQPPSCPCSSLPMAPRLCLVATQARSKCGTQVSRFNFCHAACPRL